jgi:hypothetical protein
MSSQPHSRPTEQGLSCSTLSTVENPTRMGELREMLSSFNHRCRNSLNGIKMSLYLLKREEGGPISGSLGELERSYQQLELLFDRLQVIYRPLTLTPVRSPLGRFFDERLPCWRSCFSVRGRTLDLARPAEDLPGDFDPMYLGLGLDAFVAWRAESGGANGSAQLSWRVADGFLELRWEERRPAFGSHANDRDNRQSKASGPDEGIDSLAHPLLRRIVAAHGGLVDTTCEPAFVTTVRWPRFQVRQPGNCGATGG